MDVNRRKFLALSTSGIGAIAGCNTLETGSVPTSTRTRTESVETDADTIFIGPDGSNTNDGSKNAPLESIQNGIDRAKPGETVYVLPGRYREQLHSSRPGQPNEPITLTGPREAVLRPPHDKLGNGIIKIVHDHFHLTGLTFNGLADPVNPKDPSSYANSLINCRPFPDRKFIRDIKLKPHAVGNARSGFISSIRTVNLEVGEFEVVGPAGVKYLYSDEWGHVGEVVSLGVSHDNLNDDWYQWDDPDQSHDVHVHHILNRGGYPHTELVEAHQGMYDVTIEYCTDLGGSGKYKINPNKPPSSEAAMSLRGAQCTLRWCIIRNGLGAGVHVGSSEIQNMDEFRELPEDRFPGTNNSVYGNRLLDLKGLAVAFQSEILDTGFDNGPDVQNVICGNEYNGRTMAEPGNACPDCVPESETIGHTGGNQSQSNSPTTPPSTCTVTSTQSQTNEHPVARFSYSPESPVVGETVRFDASSSADPDGQIALHKWTFKGRGKTVIDQTTGKRVEQTFQSSGKYGVMLTVIDNYGASQTITKPVHIGEAT